MSENDKELFSGEDVGLDIYDVDMNGSDALGLRGDLVRDLSSIHDDVRSVLSYGWDFEARSGDNWWDFMARYEGDRGHISVSGRPDGRVELTYRTEGVVKMPDYVEDEIEFLNINRSPEDVSDVEKEAAGINVTLEEDVDLGDEEVSRYVRDVVGLYAGVDGDASYPSRDEFQFPDDDRNKW